MSSGRKKDPIWNYYTVLPMVPGKKGSRAVCLKCKKEMQGLVARLQSHREKCQDTVDSEEDGDDDDLLLVDETGTSTAIRINTPRAQPTKTIKKASSAAANMAKFVVKTNKQEKELLDLQCARFIFATDSSFLTANHKEFIKYSEMLRPGYHPPDRKDVGGRLLDTIYHEETEKCCLELKCETVCLSSDGWSNINNDPIICNTVTKETGKVFLIETIDTSGTPHTSENLLESILNTIRTTEEKYKCRIKSFVTDNAANMKKMREELGEQTDIIAYGCSAHALNLLAQDFGKMNNNGGVRDHVIQILKYFKAHHLPKAWYEEAGGSGIILPIDVRWNSTCDSLRCYIKNWSVFAKVCEEHRESGIDRDVAAKVLNVSIKRNAEDLVAILQPIATALTFMEGNRCNIGACTSIWKDLERSLNDILQDRSAKKIFVNRYSKSITPAHLAAFLLSPKMSLAKIPIQSKEKVIQIDNVRLTDEENQSALDFMSANCQLGFMSMFYKFQARAFPFQAQSFEPEVVESLSDSEWWSAQAKFSDSTGMFIDDIKRLTTAVASSAGVERAFSKFGLTHTKLRNKLGVEKCAKLVFVSQQLNNN